MRASIERCILDVLRCGHVPRHVAIIMDGNRRFARGRSCSAHEGHVIGTSTLESVLSWCYQLGIGVVTVFAFSLENFKRPEDEVASLFRLLESKFEQLLNKRTIVDQYGVQVRVLGDLKRLPPSLQALMARAVCMSRDHTGFILNICLAYTSEHEVGQASSLIQRAIAEGRLLSSDVDDDVFRSCLLTGRCPDPDLLLRTSGESRLSDFVLWQATRSNITFSSIMWPEASLWWFVRVMLEFQVARAPPSPPPPSNSLTIDAARDERIRRFINDVCRERDERLDQLSQCTI